MLKLALHCVWSRVACDHLFSDRVPCLPSKQRYPQLQAPCTHEEGRLSSRTPNQQHVNTICRGLSRHGGRLICDHGACDTACLSDFDPVPQLDKLQNRSPALASIQACTCAHSPSTVAVAPLSHPIITKKSETQIRHCLLSAARA